MAAFFGWDLLFIFGSINILMMRYLYLPLLCLLMFTSGPKAQQQFSDVTQNMGISGQSGLGHAVGWGDIDDDGDPDLGFSNQQGDGFWFYLNEGTQFTEITGSAGLSGLGGNKIIIAEVTGDDFNDLILRTRSGTQFLFESNGDGTFNDITTAAGIAAASVYNIADFNNDGRTDLLSVSDNEFAILYNNGDATFQPPEPIGTYDSFWGAAVLDYDRDGFMDIYHTTYGGTPNILLRNNGDGTFTDATSQAGLEYADGAHGIDAGDFNNDGWTDIYLGSYSSLDCALFKNNGDGTFTDVALPTGAAGHHDTRTVAFVDYNNDGWLDIFSSHHDFYSYSNTMLRNNGDDSFTEVAESLGLSGKFIGDYFGQGWADYDLDGAIDLFAAGHIDKYRLFRNTGCPGSYLTIRLAGTESNPNGIGARVDVWFSGRRISRSLLPNGGFHDFSDLCLYFGLDGSYSVDSILVYWPSGILQKLGMTNGNQFLTIVEDETTGAGGDIPEAGTGHIRVHPNPAGDHAWIVFPEGFNDRMEISVCDANGVPVLPVMELSPGENGDRVQIHTGQLSAGMYVVKALGNRTAIVERFVVLR
ncbi:MAG: FG-GAP-like repeat-containing protein [Bacteroidales bacterium]